MKNLVNEPTEEDLVQRNFTVDRPNVLVADRHHRAPDARRERSTAVWSSTPTAAGSSAGRSTGAARRRWSTTRWPWRASHEGPGPDRSSTRTTAASSPSWGFSELIRTSGLVGSMGTIGDCYDNAPMESFWGSMQIELLNRKKWRTKIELSIAIAEWIEHFYNPERLHSSLGYVPPVEFEASARSIHLGLTLIRVDPRNRVKVIRLREQGPVGRPTSGRRAPESVRRRRRGGAGQAKPGRAPDRGPPRHGRDRGDRDPSRRPGVPGRSRLGSGPHRVLRDGGRPPLASRARPVGRGSARATAGPVRRRPDPMGRRDERGDRPPPVRSPARRRGPRRPDDRGHDGRGVGWPRVGSGPEPDRGPTRRRVVDARPSRFHRCGPRVARAHGRPRARQLHSGGQSGRLDPIRRLRRGPGRTRYGHGPAPRRRQSSDAPPARGRRTARERRRARRRAQVAGPRAGVRPHAVRRPTPASPCCGRSSSGSPRPIAWKWSRP